MRGLDRTIGRRGGLLLPLAFVLLHCSSGAETRDGTGCTTDADCTQFGATAACASARCSSPAIECIEARGEDPVGPPRDEPLATTAAAIEEWLVAAGSIADQYCSRMAACGAPQGACAEGIPAALRTTCCAPAAEFFRAHRDAILACPAQPACGDLTWAEHCPALAASPFETLCGP